MFSGNGVYVGDACFALVLRGSIFLKADAATKAKFADAGCTSFAYETKTRAVTVESFWTLPDAALDDEDALRHWCAMALEAAQQTASKKAAKAKRAGAGASSRKPATAERFGRPKRA